jgi:PAS domain S-box-containing protein
VYGFTPEEIYRGGNTVWLGRIHPDDVETVKEQFQALFERKNHFDIEYRIQRKDQSWIWVHDRALATYEKNGIWYADGIFADVTGRKLAKDALTTANKKLTLLSSITRHDINNQLTVLLGYLSILKKKQPDPTLYNYFEQAGTAAKRISTVIRFTKEYESIGVNAPAWQDSRTLVDTAAGEAPLGQVIVKNDLATGTEVFADRLFEGVFYNLFDNTLRYGGDQLKTIRISSQESDASLTIIYEDDGVGITAEDKTHLFTHSFGKNTGLGLFLAREILAITGITITENGIPGKGARFEITVPNGTWRTAGNGA